MYSVFAQGDWKFNDRLTLNAGIRYVDEEKDGIASYILAFGLDAFDINDADAFLFGPLNSCCDIFDTLIDKAPFSKSWSMWGGKLGLEYADTDDSLAYANISRGVKSGQFTDAPTSIGDGGFFRPAKPETVLSYEGGYKATWNNNTIKTNFALFYNDYTDQQQQITYPDPETLVLTSTIINAANAVTYGAEFEGQFIFGDGWFADLSVGMLETEVKEDSLGALTGGALSIEVGRELTNSPKTTINATLEKDWTLDSGDTLTAHLDARYTDARNYNLIDTPETRHIFTDPSYVLMNAFVTYRFGDGRNYKISAYVKNLTDETYNHLIQEFAIGNILLFASDPRTYGVTFGYEF